MSSVDILSFYDYDLAPEPSIDDAVSHEEIDALALKIEREVQETEDTLAELPDFGENMVEGVVPINELI